MFPSPSPRRKVGTPSKIQLDFDTAMGGSGKKDRKPSRLVPSRPATNTPRPSPRTSSLLKRKREEGAETKRSLLDSTIDSAGETWDTSRFLAFESSLFPGAAAAPADAPSSPTWAETHTQFEGEQGTIRAMRESALRGPAYPPLINPYYRTRTGSFSVSNKAHPTSARIGGHYSQHLEVMHLRKDEIFRDEGCNQLSNTDEELMANPVVGSLQKKIRNLGIPRATAGLNAGPISAPEVDICLSPRRKTRLVYEYLNPGSPRTPIREAIVDPDSKFLYNMKPVLSTNACGDGRVHAFQTSSMKFKRMLNMPLQNEANMVLDVESIASPDQRPRLRREQESRTVSLVGVHDNNRSSLKKDRKSAAFLSQSTLHPGIKEAMIADDLKHADDRYWHYILEEVKDGMIAPINPLWLSNAIAMTAKDVLPPGAEGLAKLATGRFLEKWGNVSNSIPVEERTRMSVHLSKSAVELIPHVAPSRHERPANFQLSATRLFARVWADVETRVRQLYADMMTTLERKRFLSNPSAGLSEEEEDALRNEVDAFDYRLKGLSIGDISSKNLKRMAKAFGAVVNERLAMLRDDIASLRTTLEVLVVSKSSGAENRSAKMDAFPEKDGLPHSDMPGNVAKHEENVQVSILRDMLQVYGQVWKIDVGARLSEVDVTLIDTGFCKDQIGTYSTATGEGDHFKSAFEYDGTSVEIRRLFQKSRIAFLLLSQQSIEKEIEKYETRIEERGRDNGAEEGAEKLVDLKLVNDKLVLELLNNMSDMVRLTVVQVKKTGCSIVWDVLKEEIFRLYRNSSAQSTVDYIMLHPAQRKRLRLLSRPQSLPPTQWGWGASIYLSPPSEELHDAVSRARHAIADHPRGASINNLLIADLLKVWQKYSDLSLVNLPTGDTEAQEQQWSPRTVRQFSIEQRNVASNVQSILRHEWYPSVVDIFQQASKNKVFEGVPGEVLKIFFDSVAGVMGAQLRSLVYKSIENLVQFFTRYVGDTGKDYQNEIPKELEQVADETFLTEHAVQKQRPAFAVELAVDKQMMTFKGNGQDTLNDLLNRNVELFDFLVQSLGLYKRVENLQSLDLPKFKSPEFLGDVQLDEPDLLDARQKIVKIIDTNIMRAHESLGAYSSLDYIHNSDEEISKFCEEGTENHQLGEFQDKIKQFRKTAKVIKEQRPSTISRGLFSINSGELNNQLSQKSLEIVDTLLNSIARGNQEHNRSVIKRFDVVRLESEKAPNTAEELVALEKYFDRLIARGGELERLKQSGRKLTTEVNFLWKNAEPLGGDFVLSYAVLRPMGETIKWLRKIDTILLSAKGTLRVERDRFETQLKRRKEGLLSRVGVIKKRIELFVDVTDLKSKLQQMVDDINDIDGELRREEKNIAEINTEEVTLGLPATKFQSLREAKDALAPFAKLWGVADEWRKAYHAWTTNIVFELDSEEIEKHVRTMIRTCMKVTVILEELAPKTIEVLENVRSEISQFQQHIPLISVMSNKGMRERHWDMVSEVVNAPLQPDQTSNLFSDRIERCQKHIEKLLEISDMASKEWAVEKLLLSMESEWAPLEYAFIEKYKDTGAPIVRGESVDAVQEILDEQIVKTQTLQNLPQAKIFMEKVVSWSKFLDVTQDTIDVWIQVQTSWMYLFPVFGSDDIKRALEAESLAFLQVDDEWRRVLSRAMMQPKCLKVAEIPKLLETFKKMNSMLEEIHAGLKRYLETKRLGFPRFFFLSDEELLEILAETREPRKVQSHLAKVFEGINKVKFQGKDTELEIVAMISKKSEEVYLTEPVDPLAFGSGAVEKWLKLLETVMWSSIRAEVQVAFEQYDEDRREDWLLERAAQVSLNVNQAIWTREAEVALRSGGKGGLEEFAVKMENQQDAIISLVRGQLTKLARSSLGALLVIDVHARDVINDLIAKGVSNPHDFEWQSQLRYYWEDSDLQVKIMQTSKKYGYEYIGNSGRLVITPLTDRCYRTLMGALHLQYGGAPEGPAGTGKTETTKDLSKAVAIYCIVWNCSDGLNYLAMAKFFKGLAASGAWSCFDEFNRIQVEVLSVIAQQISTIQKAIAAKEVKFTFEGTKLNINWNAAVFITMNPGYAGRAELPDNLKALFRPVAMMVPDYAMIAEIILYSCGFSDAAPLSIKIVATYKLCSELLSSQPHYDYGMRAVKSVLDAAGNLKRKFPDGNEHELVLTAIREINLPKFLFYDLPLFDGITRDLCKGCPRTTFQ